MFPDCDKCYDRKLTACSYVRNTSGYIPNLSNHPRRFPGVQAKYVGNTLGPHFLCLPTLPNQSSRNSPESIQNLSTSHHLHPLSSGHPHQSLESLQLVPLLLWCSGPLINNWQGFWMGLLMAQMVKNLLVMQETWVQSLGQEVPLEKGMATHSSVLAWRIPWTGELGRLLVHGVKKKWT